ncbi:NrsF family protein [Leptospira stimsonii]|uniref:DUF1109 domain-containing protein n=1 Tax=Leptospira stimsonii TaxID=2202203 RepID=A0A396ZBZ2_9LEPT|nr:NrsF family protein [Leptospira stimsonii]RHX90590.1 DUF1109 domain-containing protein [Leptospira stimsonii]
MLSKEQRTESLIQKMAAEPPLRRNVWGSFVVLFPLLGIGLILLFLSLYPITAPMIHIPTLFPDFLWIGIVGFSAYWILFQLRFPEESFSKSSKLPILLGLIWVLYSGGLYAWDIIEDHEFSHHVGRCSATIFFSSILLCGSGLFILRNGNPGNPILSSAVLSIFSLALANLCLKFVCGDQSSYHIFFSHVLSSLFLFFISFFVFKNILKW